MYKNTGAMRGPDCQTDTCLIKTTLFFSVKPSYSKIQVIRKQKLESAQQRNTDCQRHLQAAINSALSEKKAEEELPEGLWKSINKGSSWWCCWCPGICLEEGWGLVQRKRWTYNRPDRWANHSSVNWNEQTICNKPANVNNCSVYSPEKAQGNKKRLVVAETWGNATRSGCQQLCHDFF